MADKSEEAGVAMNDPGNVEATPETQLENEHLTLPEGKKYRRFLGLPGYASPKFQLGMVAFVCFLCPGMFNALGGLGGGGKADATLADNMVSRTCSLDRNYVLRSIS
jgi:hypothetical protein